MADVRRTELLRFGAHDYAPRPHALAPTHRHLDGTAKGDAGWLQATRSGLTAGTAHRAGGRPGLPPTPSEKTLSVIL